LGEYHLSSGPIISQAGSRLEAGSKQPATSACLLLNKNALPKLGPDSNYMDRNVCYRPFSVMSPQGYFVWTHTDSLHFTLAGLQDELEGITTVGGEHKDKGEACIPQKEVQPIMEIV
jgi:hypothetical protein